MIDRSALKQNLKEKKQRTNFKIIIVLNPALAPGGGGYSTNILV